MFKRDWSAHASNRLVIINSVLNLIGAIGDQYDHLMRNVRIFTKKL